MFRSPLVLMRDARRAQSPRAPTLGMLFSAALLLLAMAHPTRLPADTPDYDAYKATFWEAKRALAHGDYATFGRHSAKLENTPLYPYLLYWHLDNRLSRQLPLTIEAFLQRYDGTPPATLLRQSWLEYLTSQHRWADYIAFYEENEVPALQCHYHYAQHKTGNETAAWEGARRMWLVGQSQDKACDPLFAAWQKAGGLTREHRWQRIELAMANGETEIANHVAAPLSKADRNLLNLWQRAYKSPSLLRDKALREDNELNRTILSHIIQYRALRAPITTTPLWEELEPKYAFSPEQRHAIARAIGIGHTYANDARALEWFAQLPPDARDPEVCRYALRIALRTENWGSALAWLEVMPNGENRSTMALYWRARIYANMGFPDTARYLFKTVSKERSYYGFLAADRLNLPYNLSHDPLDVDFKVLQRVAFRPDIMRAQELYHLGITSAARHEWTEALAKLNREELLAAGKLADTWGWQDRALLTLARADHFDDLNIRFPLSFSDAVIREAKRRSLDPAWVYAVVRQESAMMPFVKSHVGAMGLMQVMPQTGLEIARELQLDHFDTRQLLKPDTNIHFGSYYLGQALKEFNDNPVLATAAYNAGPHRIRKWTPRQGELDADIWIDTIPFDETREYVRRVMAYTVFYDQRLDKPVTRLSERMKPIGKTPRVSACKNCRRKEVIAQAHADPLN